MPQSGFKSRRSVWICNGLLMFRDSQLYDVVYAPPIALKQHFAVHALSRHHLWVGHFDLYSCGDRLESIGIEMPCYWFNRLYVSFD